MDGNDVERLDRLEAAVARIEASLAGLCTAVARLEAGESNWQKEQAKRISLIDKTTHECEMNVALSNNELQKLVLIWSTAATLRPSAPAAQSQAEPPAFEPKEHVPTLRPALDEAEGGSP